jgi:DNA-binding CsgD family transcriptional regulator
VVHVDGQPLRRGAGGAPRPGDLRRGDRGLPDPTRVRGHDARGRLALARGDRLTAERELRACAESFGPAEIGPTFSPWRSSLALSLQDAQRDEAIGLVDEELALAGRSGLPRPTGIALRAAGLLEGGEAGIALLRRAVEELERSEARLHLAHAHLALGAALRRAGRRTDARPELTAALTLAQRCGAERLAERAFDELRVAGARPRRRATTGPAALTARELRVAQLAARGHSNARIAQELFVSAKTIETHLSHIYAKLDLRGQGARRALAVALTSGEWADGDEPVAAA